jgi:prolyl-tRNA synthetase
MKLTECRAIEVGNTFKLGTRFTDAFDLKVINPQGQLQSVLMCCYGIGTTRLVGAIAEVCSDELGLVWPEQVAPYDAHLITLGVNDSAVDELKYKTIKALTGSGVSVLIDDRSDVRAGEKFHDADLIGIPKQVIIGKHASESRVEFKKRGVKQADIVDLERLQGIFRP